jgi:thiamine pyrophosphate-dependent acetolactate synthase large subunit-like protein
MSQTVSDFFVARLVAWGVKRIYGYPGGGINGVLGALNRAHGQIEFIQVRHEEMAAFMACTHAKFTGEIGVCLSTGGPGAAHLITGLYDAKLDHMPVPAICGQAPRTSEARMISRNRIWTGCFPMSPTTCRKHRCRRRCATSSTAAGALRSAGDRTRR